MNDSVRAPAKVAQARDKSKWVEPRQGHGPHGETCGGRAHQPRCLVQLGGSSGACLGSVGS